eukprot:10373489-Prorocentrum_lima.AAC.1
MVAFLSWALRRSVPQHTPWRTVHCQIVTSATAQWATAYTVAHRLSRALRRSVPQHTPWHTVYHERYGAVGHNIHRGAPSFFEVDLFLLGSRKLASSNADVGELASLQLAVQSGDSITKRVAVP